MPFDSKDYFETYPDESEDGMMLKKNVVVAPLELMKITTPNKEGACLLAGYYREKYGVNIVNIENRDNFSALVAEYREKSGHVKVGFIVRVQTRTGIHSVPVIYEKKDNRESIIILDSLGPTEGFKEDIIADINGIDHEHRINIYECKGRRQSDQHGCKNDAFIILKDALRENHITALLKNVTLRWASINIQGMYLRAASIYQKYYSFELPEKWSKGVQNKNYSEGYKTKPDMNVAVLRGNPFKPSQTLKQHRNKYAAKVQIETSTRESIKESFGKPSVKTKAMNVYVKQKGYSNVRRVERFFNQHHQEIAEIYAAHSDREFKKPAAMPAQQEAVQESDYFRSIKSSVRDEKQQSQGHLLEYILWICKREIKVFDHELKELLRRFALVQDNRIPSIQQEKYKAAELMVFNGKTKYLQLVCELGGHGKFTDINCAMQSEAEIASLVAVLWKLGFDIDHQDDNDNGNTILIKAVRQKNNFLLKTLLQYYINPTVRDEQKNTALCYAIPTEANVGPLVDPVILADMINSARLLLQYQLTLRVINQIDYPACVERQARVALKQASGIYTTYIGYIVELFECYHQAVKRDQYFSAVWDTTHGSLLGKVKKLVECYHDGQLKNSFYQSNQSHLAAEDLLKKLAPFELESNQNLLAELEKFRASPTFTNTPNKTFRALLFWVESKIRHQQELAPEYVYSVTPC